MIKPDSELLITDPWLSINVDWEDCVAWFGCYSYTSYPLGLKEHFDQFADERAAYLAQYEALGFNLVDVASIGLNALTEALP